MTSLCIRYQSVVFLLTSFAFDSVVVGHHDSGWLNFTFKIIAVILLIAIEKFGSFNYRR